MKKYLKQVLSLLLVFSILITSAHPVDAASSKLNTTSKTMYVGGSYKLKVSGTSKAVNWRSSKKSVATVSQKGVVKAKKAGRTTITAKVGKKSLRCSIRVKTKKKGGKTFSKKGVSGTFYKKTGGIGQGMVAIIKNNNKYAVSVKIRAAFKKDGKEIYSSSEDNYALEAGRTGAMDFQCLSEETYDSYSYTIEVKNSLYDGCVKNIKIGKSKIHMEFLLSALETEVKNTGSKETLCFIKLMAVYYDSKGRVIDAAFSYADCREKGQTDTVRFSLPVDKNYHDIRPASYKIYVNYAYR